MSRRVCRYCSGRATAGSYSTNACSCVRLTATLSTPGNRPSAFSIVPVQREQWRPPMRARIFRRFALADGSSLHSSNAEAAVAEPVIEVSMGAVVRGARESKELTRSVRPPLRDLLPESPAFESHRRGALPPRTSDRRAHELADY